MASLQKHDESKISTHAVLNIQVFKHLGRTSGQEPLEVGGDDPVVVVVVVEGGA